MGRLGEIWRRMAMLVRRRSFERELAEELLLHLEMKKTEQVVGGTDPAEAGYAANRRLGNAAVLREYGRDVWGWRWLEDFAQDLRFGARMLGKNRGFTAVAVVTLAFRGAEFVPIDAMPS